MTTLLAHEIVTSSLFKYWSDTFSEPVTTIYPGMKVNTTDLPEWIEISVDSWFRRPQRIGGISLNDVAITIHCFVKAGTDSGRVQELTDAARTVFSQQTLELRDFSVSETPLVGHLRLKEPETRNLTRNIAGSSQTTLHHMSILIRGTAQGGAE